MKLTNGAAAIAGLRPGSENRASQYWREADDRTYRMCREIMETLEHKMKDCEVTRAANKSWRALLRKGREKISSMNNII